MDQCIQKHHQIMWRIRSLNNNAVHRYECGDFSCAFEILNVAVHEILNSNSDDNDQYDDIVTCQIHSSNDDVCGSKCLQKKNIDDSVLESTRYSIYPPNECYLCQDIYDAMFLFGNGIQFSQAETISTILFNLALVYQKSGIQSNQLQYLLKSIHFYKMSLSYLVESDCTSTIGMMVLKLALHCNLYQAMVDAGSCEISYQAPIRNRCLVESIRYLHARPHVRIQVLERDVQFLFNAVHQIATMKIGLPCSPAA
jgi:hypothetical protein